jgi:predicted lipoprotein with Yx(FWY)xxD motif
MKTQAPNAYKSVIGGEKHRANLRASMLIAVAVIVGIGLIGGTFALLHKSHKKTPDTAASSEQAPTPNAPKPGAVQFSNAVLMTQTFSELGQYLATPSGQAVYTYDKDTTGVSTCTGSCLQEWPIYKATTTTGLPANITIVVRTDGQQQYAYKGKPLYTFAQDTDGQVTGDGLNGFDVAKP